MMDWEHVSKHLASLTPDAGKLFVTRYPSMCYEVVGHGAPKIICLDKNCIVLCIGRLPMVRMQLGVAHYSTVWLLYAECVFFIASLDDLRRIATS